MVAMCVPTRNAISRPSLIEEFGHSPTKFGIRIRHSRRRMASAPSPAWPFRKADAHFESELSRDGSHGCRLRGVRARRQRTSPSRCLACGARDAARQLCPHLCGDLRWRRSGPHSVSCCRAVRSIIFCGLPQGKNASHPSYSVTSKFCLSPHRRIDCRAAHLQPRRRWGE